MKVLLINGSPRANGCTFTALNEVIKGLESGGVSGEIFQLGAKPVQGCIACAKCRETGRCVFDDAANMLNSRMAEFSGIVLGSPVYYAAPNGALCALLDRLFFSSGGKMQGKPGAAVVSARRAGTTAALDRLNKYLSISQMPIVGSQYWNMVHGNAPEEVMQDKEGMQTMRTLGRNMAWLINCIANSGVPFPAQEEPRERTNFIR